MLFPTLTAAQAWTTRSMALVRAWGVEVDRMIAMLADLYPDTFPGPLSLRADTIFASLAGVAPRGANVDDARRWGHEVEAALTACTPVGYTALTLTKRARVIFTPGAGGVVLADVLVWAAEIVAFAQGLNTPLAILGNKAGAVIDFLSRHTGVRQTDYGPLALSTPDALLTVTRASTASYMDSDGVLKFASTNVLRYDYDPVTLAPKGARIEGARTNLFSKSQEFDHADWSKTRTTCTANAVAAPDGTTTADKIVENTDTNSHYVGRSITPTIATVCTFSAFVKAAERTRVELQIFPGGNLVAANTVNVNLSTGAVTSSDATRTRVQAYPNGWYRIATTVTSLNGSAVTAAIVLHDGSSTSYTGNGTSGLYVWGAQWEVGAFVSSYIPTTTASAARSADRLQILASLLPYIDAAGTLFADYDLPALITLDDRHVVGFASNSAGSFNNINYLELNTGSDLRYRHRSGGTDQCQITSAAKTPGARVRQAGAWALNDFELTADGASVGTDVSGTPVVLADPRLVIGSAASSSSGGETFATFRRVAYIPRRITSAELVSLTA